jgi:hypothetical protein
MGLSWWEDVSHCLFFASIGRRNGMCDGKSRGYDRNNN